MGIGIIQNLMITWSRLRKALGHFVHIEDTPHSIALGIAIGIFFGFTPLFGLKTVLSLLFALVFRANKIATVIAVSLHDVLLPFMPAVFRLEYVVGYFLMNNPHEWPARLSKIHLKPHEWLSWTTFFTVGVPLLVGSIIFSLPISVASYLIARATVERHRLRHPKLLAPPPPPESPILPPES